MAWDYAIKTLNTCSTYGTYCMIWLDFYNYLWWLTNYCDQEPFGIHEEMFINVTDTSSAPKNKIYSIVFWIITIWDCKWMKLKGLSI